MLKEKNVKMELLDECHHYEDMAHILRQAYYAAKYKDWNNALHHLISANCSGLPDKRYDELKEAVRKEQK